jgi:hypothetical protein
LVYGIPLIALEGGNGTRRETTIDKVFFDKSGIMMTVVPTLESVGPQRIAEYVGGGGGRAWAA